MKLHANARLSAEGRELLIDRMLTQGWSLTQAAEAPGVSERTTAKGPSPCAPSPRAFRRRDVAAADLF
jgi:leucine-zipper of insertion element IS481